MLSLIGQMVPSFISDWKIGLDRFKTTNPHFTEFDNRGRPVFSGWIFNGFDTARKRRTPTEINVGAAPRSKEMIQADRTMHERVVKAIKEDLVHTLTKNIKHYAPIAAGLPENFRIGDIEDANVLIQNSLWLKIPLSELASHKQVISLRDRSKWAENQLEQIELFKEKFGEAAQNVVRICV